MTVTIFAEHAQNCTMKKVPHLLGFFRLNNLLQQTCDGGKIDWCVISDPTYQ